MPYQVINVGKVFSSKGSEQFSGTLNQHESQGWQFHSIFAVTERTGCLGTQSSETLYMVLKR